MGRIRTWIGRSILLAGGVILLLAGVYWFVVPRVADSVLRDRLASVESRMGLEADYGRLETSVLDGTSLFDVRLGGGGDGDELVTIDRVQIQLDPASIVSGEPTVSSLTFEGIELYVRRRADDTPHWRRLMRRLRAGGDPSSSKSQEQGSESTDRSSSWLRYFGGEWPSVTVRDATVHFESDEGAPPWPVASTTWDRVQVASSGQTASVEAKGALERGEGRPQWSIPNALDIEGMLRWPLEDSTGRVSLKDPLEVTNLAPHPYLRAGIGAVHVSEQHALELRGLSLALQSEADTTSLAALDRTRVQFDDWPRSPDDLDVEAILVEGPRVDLELQRQYGSNWEELRHLLRAPLAREVAERARTVADELADASDDEDRDASSKTSSGPTITERFLDGVKRFIQDASLPDEVRIREGTLAVTDHRRLDVDRPADRLAIRRGRVTLEHREMAGGVHLEAGFEARANGESRGSASGDVTWTYRSGSFEWSGEADDLDLSWLAQMAGPRLARYVRGGQLRGTIDARPDDEGRQAFSGFVSLERGHLDMPRLAEEPIEALSTSYHFEGFYEADASIPEPEHIRAGDIYPSETSSSGPPDRPRASSESEDDSTEPEDDSARDERPSDESSVPRRGALVLTEGRAEWNGVKADVQPALYGLDGGSSLPARLDLQVSLPETEIQTLLDSVPKAIRGPLNGTEIKGQLGWEFDAEFPLHNADETEWTSTPTLSDVELVELPDEVDVRKLEESFEHTIEIETEDYHVERTVDIPAMRPTPAEWLVDNGEMTLETIDERRREREWPKRPTLEALDPDRHVPEAYDKPKWVDDRTPTHKWMKHFADSPEVWLSSILEDRYPDTPWGPDQRLASIDKIDVPDDREPVPYVRDLIARQQRGRPIRLLEPDDGWPEVHETEASDDDATETASMRPSEGASDRRGRYLTGVDDGERTRSESSRSAKDVSGESPPIQSLDDSIFITYDPDDRSRTRVHPYGPYVYVPLHHIAKWMPRAIMTTEDNSLFEHHGFNWFAVKDSLEDNLEAGGFVRGASTVSMQLIKNLFLSFDKVIARKLREVFLVWIMEDVVDLPKSRIVELYLNIIEFGPGIFGIHDAAVHYFGKRPDQLTLREVAWLTSIIPDPRKYHRYYERGEIDDYWFEGMKHYVDIMHERERATSEDVEKMKREKPTFFKPEEGKPKLRSDSERSKDDEASTMEEVSDILE